MKRLRANACGYSGYKCVGIAGFNQNLWTESQCTRKYDIAAAADSYLYDSIHNFSRIPQNIKSLSVYEDIDTGISDIQIITALNACTNVIDPLSGGLIDVYESVKSTTLQSGQCSTRVVSLWDCYSSSDIHVPGILQPQTSYQFSPVVQPALVHQKQLPSPSVDVNTTKAHSVHATQAGIAKIAADIQPICTEFKLSISDINGIALGTESQAPSFPVSVASGHIYTDDQHSWAVSAIQFTIPKQTQRHGDYGSSDTWAFAYPVFLYIFKHTDAQTSQTVYRGQLYSTGQTTDQPSALTGQTFVQKVLVGKFSVAMTTKPTFETLDPDFCSQPHAFIWIASLQQIICGPYKIGGVGAQFNTEYVIGSKTQTIDICVLDNSQPKTISFQIPAGITSASQGFMYVKSGGITIVPIDSVLNAGVMYITSASMTPQLQLIPTIQC